MFCTKCGNELKDGASFCTACGEAVKPSSAEETAAPVAEEAAPAAETVAPVAPVLAAQPTGDGDGVPHNGKVSFGEAIKLLFMNYVNFTGRASKSEFWWGFLFLCIVNFAATYIPVIGGLISLAVFLPNLSLCIRRLHDIGKSWVWILMGLIPLAGFIILIVYYCKPSEGDNQWGKGPVA